MEIWARMARAAVWIHSPAGCDGPGPDERPLGAVGDETEGAVGVGFVSPGSRDRVGEVEFGGGDVEATLAGLVGGQADSGDLGLGEHDAGMPL